MPGPGTPSSFSAPSPCKSIFYTVPYLVILEHRVRPLSVMDRWVNERYDPFDQMGFQELVQRKENNVHSFVTIILVRDTEYTSLLALLRKVDFILSLLRTRSYKVTKPLACHETVRLLLTNFRLNRSWSSVYQPAFPQDKGFISLSDSHLKYQHTTQRSSINVAILDVRQKMVVTQNNWEWESNFIP